MSLPDGLDLIGLDEMTEATATVVRAGQHTLVLVRKNDKAFAYINNCPHQNRPLSLPSGKVIVSEDTYIVCPFHGASFDMTSGQCRGGPAGSSVLQAVPVKVIDNRVIVA